LTSCRANGHQRSVGPDHQAEGLRARYGLHLVKRVKTGTIRACGRRVRVRARGKWLRQTGAYEVRDPGTGKWPWQTGMSERSPHDYAPHQAIGTELEVSSDKRDSYAPRRARGDALGKFPVGGELWRN
jgi:hypothetical protein